MTINFLTLVTCTYQIMSNRRKDLHSLSIFTELDLTTQPQTNRLSKQLKTPLKLHAYGMSCLSWIRVYWMSASSGSKLLRQSVMHTLVIRISYAFISKKCIEIGVTCNKTKGVARLIKKWFVSWRCLQTCSTGRDIKHSLSEHL